MSNARQTRAKGSVMIFAVLLMTAGVFVLAAVLQLSATQGLSGEEEWAAVQRRVTLGNSRSMAREHLLTRLFRIPQATNNWPAVFVNTLGGFTNVPASDPSDSYWRATSETNTNTVLTINPFNLMEHGGFYRANFQADLVDGNTNTDGSTPWTFALRTRSPVTAGYCFVQQRPADNNLADYASPPYIDMNGTNEQFFGFYGLPRVPYSSVTNTSVDGDASGYQGFLDVPAGFYTNNLEFDPADVVTAIRSATTNPMTGAVAVQEYRVELDLTATNTAQVVSPGVWTYTVPANAGPLTNPKPVTQVVLKGAPFNAPSVDIALHVVWTNTNAVSSRDLTLQGDINERPVYVYGSSSIPGAVLSVSAPDGGSWRLGITMMRCGINFEAGGLEVRGGLRTDGSIDSSGSGLPSFVPGPSESSLDAIADRMMWLEDYRAPQ